MTITSFDTPNVNCHHCGAELDASTGDEAGPRPGDLSMCLYCGTLSVYNDDMTIRDLNAEEALQAAGDPVIIRIQEARSHVRDLLVLGGISEDFKKH